ncbi:MAG: radical SAM protein, partial [Acidobacteria bacterium]|nr:radical SAM protein [Acidobacteriota bacterium]
GAEGAEGAKGAIARLKFRVPVRDLLPPLAEYATLQHGDERHTVGYTEASRGCKHRCRHCPIVPVYDGRFRIVAADVVVADARAQVDAGARHITFGDPDFFNGIRHAREVIERFARDCPDVTYDVTIKVEHLLNHADALPLLRATGCAFVTSAVESLDDTVLARLEKGHTRRDFERVVSLCRDAGLPLSPTFVAFTPWTTIPGYLELLHEIDRLELVEHVAPIQYAIRLLIPQRSRMLELADVMRIAGPFDPLSLTHPWKHPDPRVDALQESIGRLVGVRMNASRRDVFERVWTAAHAFASAVAPARTQPVIARATVPYLNEPWYC